MAWKGSPKKEYSNSLAFCQDTALKWRVEFIRYALRLMSAPLIATQCHIMAVTPDAIVLVEHLNS